MVVSAAVVGAALFGGSAISDPRAPLTKIERLVAVPATPSPYPTATPSRFSRAPRASAHARPECQRLDAKPAVCHRAEASVRQLHDRQRASALHQRRPSGEQRPLSRPITQRSTLTKKPTLSRNRPRPRNRRLPRRPAAPPAMTRAPTGRTRSSTELNDERANHGLPALKLNSKLVSSAHTHNLAMAKAEHAEPPAERRGCARFPGLGCWLPMEHGRREHRLQQQPFAKSAFSPCRRRCTTRSRPTTGTARTS